MILSAFAIVCPGPTSPDSKHNKHNRCENFLKQKTIIDLKSHDSAELLGFIVTISNLKWILFISQRKGKRNNLKYEK
jgi:hypothetical protein